MRENEISEKNAREGLYISCDNAVGVLVGCECSQVHLHELGPLMSQLTWSDSERVPALSCQKEKCSITPLKNKEHKNVESKQTAIFDQAPLTSPSSLVVSIDTVMQSRLCTK